MTTDSDLMLELIRIMKSSRTAKNDESGHVHNLFDKFDMNRLELLEERIIKESTDE